MARPCKFRSKRTDALVIRLRTTYDTQRNCICYKNVQLSKFVVAIDSLPDDQRSHQHLPSRTFSVCT